VFQLTGSYDSLMASIVLGYNYVIAHQRSASNSYKVHVGVRPSVLGTIKLVVFKQINNLYIIRCTIEVMEGVFPDHVCDILSG